MSCESSSHVASFAFSGSLFQMWMCSKGGDYRGCFIYAHYRSVQTSFTGAWGGGSNKMRCQIGFQRCRIQIRLVPSQIKPWVVVSDLDINCYMLSYFEGTANLNCYTSCRLTNLHCSKVSFLQSCHIKIYNKIFTKIWGVYSLLWDTVYIYIYISGGPLSALTCCVTFTYLADAFIQSD